MKNQIFIFSILLAGCSLQSQPGPDKQVIGSLQGAASGAAAGAIYGAQVGALGGPAAFAGAGIGAVAGGIRGRLQDSTEETQMQIESEVYKQRQKAIVFEALNEHYKRRMELHPTRDIFPADWFFNGGEVSLKSSAKVLVDELARLNKQRMPWSRLVVACYVKSNDPKSEYAHHLSERRAREIADYLVRAGIEPQRIETRAVIIDKPILIDPHDDPTRYNQAIEIIPLDR